MTEASVPVKVDTIRDLSVALGQPAVLADVLKHPNRTVNSWINRGYIPGKYYLRHTRILAGLKIEAHPSIWEQSAPPGHEQRSPD